MNLELLLSHHGPEESGRCVKLPGLPALCRRCLFLYPLAFGVMALQVATSVVPPSWQLPLMLLLPLPAAVDFCREQLGLTPYRPLPVVASSLLLAPALGIGLARYLLDPTDALFWGMVLIFGSPSGAALLYRKWGDIGPEGG